jgi:hypothetical protein
MKWVFPLVYGGVGLGLLAGGLIWGWSRYALCSGGLRAQGMVVENYRSDPSDSGDRSS